jgi:hypothetical protein
MIHKWNAGPFLRIFSWGGGAGAFFEKGPFCEIINILEDIAMAEGHVCDRDTMHE